MWSNEDKWECAHRELVIRIRVYAKQVAHGKMTEREAGREIALMSAIAQDYKRLMEAERQPDFFKDQSQPDPLAID